MWVAGPAAAGILGDWGADVVKIEPPDGDPFRGLLSAFGRRRVEPAVRARQPQQAQHRPEPVARPKGRAIAAALVDGADVFVTNARPARWRAPGSTTRRSSARNPRLVYAHVTGYGIEGDERDRAAYDVGAFWSRAGRRRRRSPRRAPTCRTSGAGWATTWPGMAAAGAVAAALLARERTGEGQLVSISLLRIGMYMIGWDISMSLRLGIPTIPMTVNAPPNPLINAYDAGDGRRFWMLGLQADRHWPDVLRAVDRPEWADDERFSLDRGPVAALGRAGRGAQRDLRHAAAGRVGARSSTARTCGGRRCSTPTRPSTIRRPAPRVASSTSRRRGGDPCEMVASPVDFGGTPWAPRSMPPEFAQHTEEVLLELGYDWDRIIELKELGAIP